MHPLSLFAALTLDLLVGDPHWLPHPVRWIGRLVASCDRLLYPVKGSPCAEFFAGMALCLIVIAGSAGTGWLILSGLRYFSLTAVIAGEALIGFYCLSARSLAFEAQRVVAHLKAGDIVKARRALSMIVGRDTDNLDEKGISRAAVETVAENITDGIVSPLFYLLLGGPVAALAFKAVSTMDSMIGYKNERYRHFGTCAAWLDDLLNFIPARLTGFILVPAAAIVLGFDSGKSIFIVKRDRLKHESPNSAHGEAAVAGALGIQLGGQAIYRGVVSTKPFLGDSHKEIDREHIPQTIRILYVVTLICAATAITLLFVWNRMAFL